jgi:hypothetical protein
MGVFQVGVEKMDAMLQPLKGAIIYTTNLGPPS